MAIKQPETAAMGSVGESGEDLIAKSSNKISEANIRPLRNGADLNGSIDSSRGVATGDNAAPDILIALTPFRHSPSRGRGSLLAPLGLRDSSDEG